MTMLFQVLWRLVIFIRIRVGNLVGKDVRLGLAKTKMSYGERPVI